MKGKGIKSAIAASALSAVLCAGMLVGTTFAWFTDTVTSTGNTIMAGNLDITATKAELDPAAEAQYTVGEYALAFGEAVEFDGEAIISEDAFAPGAWNAKLLTVSNAENLSAIVKLEFVTEDGGLEDALWFDFVQVEEGVATGTLTERPMSTLTTFASALEFTLEAGEQVSFILIYGMNEEAGNSYQGAVFTADAYILARQNAEESQYDTHPDQVVTSVATEQELREALTEAVAEGGGYIQLSDNVEMTGDLYLGSSDTTLDLNGNTLSASGIIIDIYSGESSDKVPEPVIENGIFIQTAASFYGNAIDIYAEEEMNVTLCDLTVTAMQGETAINVNGEDVTCTIDNVNVTGKVTFNSSGAFVINGGTFIANPGDTWAIETNCGGTINGGTFRADGTVLSFSHNDYHDLFINGGEFISSTGAAPIHSNSRPGTSLSGLNIEIADTVLFNGKAFSECTEDEVMSH